MAQTSGQLPAASDSVKKRITAMMAPKKTEAVPGLMATRNELKSLRSRTIPKGHTRRGSR